MIRRPLQEQRADGSAIVILLVRPGAFAKVGGEGNVQPAFTFRM
jgi:hypothetical protein